MLRERPACAQVGCVSLCSMDYYKVHLPEDLHHSLKTLLHSLCYFSITHIMKRSSFIGLLNHNPYFKALEGMCAKRCQDLQPINFMKQRAMRELTIQNSIIHLGFSQNLSESPDSSSKHPVQEKEVHTERKGTWRQTFCSWSVLAGAEHP